MSSNAAQTNDTERQYFNKVCKILYFILNVCTRLASSNKSQFCNKKSQAGSYFIINSSFNLLKLSLESVNLLKLGFSVQNES